MTAPRPFDPLTRAAIRHGSDKFGGHLYTPVYHELFASRREETLKMLEIGIGGYNTPMAGGLSLRMWLDYFPYAEITGLDIEKKIFPLPPRARIYQGSQTNTAVLALLCEERGPFDIIIDDGSHDPEHMIASFLFLYPRMAEHGIYVVEDAQTCFHGGRNGRGTIFDIAHQIGLGMHRLEGFNDPQAPAAFLKLGEITRNVAIYRNQVVFRRGANVYPSNAGLNLEHEQVRETYAAIAAEAALNPAPGGALSRIDMLIWGNRRQEAAVLASEAAARWPKEQALLHELVRMMEWADQKDVRDEIAARLVALERELGQKP